MNYISPTIHYFFQSSPGSNFKFYIPLAVLTCLLFLASIAIHVVYKNKKSSDFAFKRMFKKTSNRLFWLAFLELFLTIVRYENIPYFSMRLWLYLSFALIAYYIYKLVHDYKVNYPKEKANIQSSLNNKDKTKEKYLPNKKKR